MEPSNPSNAVPVEVPIPSGGGAQGEDRPLGGNKLDEIAIGQKGGSNPFGELEDNGKDMDNTLEGRLKSGDAKVRAAAFDELIQWSDAEFTPAIFAKGLHLTVKEKDSAVIDKIVTAIESLMEKQPGEFATVDMKKFLPNYTEFLMNNAKGTAKDHASAFVVKLWEKTDNKTELLERIKEMIATVKMKLQEKALVVVLELLKAGKIEEMQLLKPLYPELEKQLVSRTAAIKAAAFDVYKETFLWIGEGLKTFTKNMKEAQQKDLEAYMKSVDPKSMKSLKKDEVGGKQKKFDIYDSIQEAELPKPYNEEEFADEVMALTKWKERKDKLDELVKVLEERPRLNQKTNAFIYLNLAKRIFMESNIAVQVSIIRVLGLLAAGMRKGFGTVGKTMFPVLLGKLKEKNRQLSEEILSTLEKFYFVLTFEETADEIEEGLRDKNPEKKINVLNLLFVLIDKLDKIKTPANAVRVAKIVVKLLDENDSVIREKASELIAKQLDSFEEKINPLLKDLPAQKMAKIMKYRQKMSTIPLEEPGKVADKADDKAVKKEAEDDAKDKKTKRNVSDKAQMIAKLREEVFSNRRVKLSDVRSFSMYLFSSLSQLIELTKEFKEITPTQASEIFLFIDEITQKVEKAAFQEDARKIIAQFYSEQLLGKNSEELAASLDRYKNCSSRIMSPRLFLQDLLNVLNKKPVKLSKELLSEILTLYENEVTATNRLANIPHGLFVEFLKINFSMPNIHASMKAPLVQTMRILSNKFGEKATNDFPQVLFKELNTQNSDLQKTFEKTYEKLVSLDPDKNKQAISELSGCEDHSKVSYFWSKPEFIAFLKSQLNSDGRVYLFGDICKIVSNYLVTKAESPSDFKIKHYLSVFTTILGLHYSSDHETKKTETEEIVNKTVESLGAPAVMNEMIADPGLSQNKMQILNFFFQFSYAIEPSIRFITYISNIIDPRGIPADMQRLLDLVLLVIKNANDDEVVLRGCENRYIRDVWQKHEVDLLINDNLVRGSKVFEDQTTYNMTKGFLMANLRLEEADFHAYELDKVVFGAKEAPLKLRLAFYFLRSTENIRSNCVFLLTAAPTWKPFITSRDENLIALKTIFNVLRNLVYMQHTDVYRRGRDLFCDMVSRSMNPNDFRAVFDLNFADTQFYDSLIRKQEVKFVVDRAETEADLPEPSFIGQPQFMQTNTRLQNVAAERTKVNQLRIEEPFVTAAPRVPESPIGKSTKKRGLLEAANQRANTNRANNVVTEYPGMNSNDVSYIMTVAMLEKPEVLQQQFDRMLTFDLGEFQDASQYFQDLSRLTTPSAQDFLCQYANEIVDTFVTVSATIFQEGINYELDRPSYELLFVPLQMLFNVHEFLWSLQGQVLSRLVNHVVFRLVDSNEEKNLNMQEGDEERIMLTEFIIKFWNSLMLRIIDKAEHNALIASLFATVMGLQVETGDSVEVGVFNLSMRCLSKILKNFRNTIRLINASVIFGHIHRYIQRFGAGDADSLGSKTVKSLVNELVTHSDFQEVWGAYNRAFGNGEEQTISKWIRIAQGKQIEAQVIDKIQVCENRGTEQAALELADFFVQMRNEFPALDITSYVPYFQDPGFLEVVVSEIPPPEIDPSAFSRNKPNATGRNGAKNVPNNPPRTRHDAPTGRNAPRTGTNAKKSVDRFKKNVNIDQILDKSEISHLSEMADFRESNGRRIKR